MTYNKYVILLYIYEYISYSTLVANGKEGFILSKKVINSLSLY